MKASTIRLHERLISLLKGVVKAWEDWLKDCQVEAEHERLRERIQEPPKAQD